MKETITQRLERAKRKALPLIEKWHGMDLDIKLKYIRENSLQYKHERNIINRYYNLVARDNNYPEGQKGFKK